MKIQHSHQIVKFFVQLMRNLFRCRLTGLRSCWRAHFQSKSSHYGAKNWRNSDGRARVKGAPNLCSFRARFAFGLDYNDVAGVCIFRKDLEHLVEPLIRKKNSWNQKINQVWTFKKFRQINKKKTNCILPLGDWCVGFSYRCARIEKIEYYVVNILLALFTNKMFMLHEMFQPQNLP